MNSKEKGKINKHIKSFSHYSIINSKIPKSIIGLKALTKNDINKKNNFNIYQNNNMKLLNKKLNTHYFFEWDKTCSNILASLLRSLTIAPDISCSNPW